MTTIWQQQRKMINSGNKLGVETVKAMGKGKGANE